MNKKVALSLSPTFQMGVYNIHLHSHLETNTYN